MKTVGTRTVQVDVDSPSRAATLPRSTSSQRPFAGTHWDRRETVLASSSLMMRGVGSEARTGACFLFRNDSPLGDDWCPLGA